MRKLKALLGESKEFFHDQVLRIGFLLCVSRIPKTNEIFTKLVASHVQELRSEQDTGYTIISLMSEVETILIDSNADLTLSNTFVHRFLRNKLDGQNFKTLKKLKLKI